MSTFKKIGVIAKKDDDSVLDSLKIVIKFLENKQIDYFLDENSARLLKKNEFFSIDDICNKPFKKLEKQYYYGFSENLTKSLILDYSSENEQNTLIKIIIISIIFVISIILTFLLLSITLKLSG